MCCIPSNDVLRSLFDPLCNVWLTLDAVVETGNVGVAVQSIIISTHHVREQMVDCQVGIRQLEGEREKG